MKSKPVIVELDFGMGNIRSLQKAFEHFDQPVMVSEEADKIHVADAILLPGDGAFGRAMEELKKREMYEAVVDFQNSGRPVFGICIGFQVLFTSSSEFGNHPGFGFISGNIEKFDEEKKIVPHMGWNITTFLKHGRLGTGLPEQNYFYYVHSYRNSGRCEYTTAVCTYENEFTAIIEKDNLFATQFHPEKSHNAGMKIIENFLKVLN